MPQKERIGKFFLLRASLGPLVEGIILLDRLKYLLEQVSLILQYSYYSKFYLYM